MSRQRRRRYTTLEFPGPQNTVFHFGESASARKPLTALGHFKHEITAEMQEQVGQEPGLPESSMTLRIWMRQSLRHLDQNVVSGTSEVTGEGYLLLRRMITGPRDITSG